jgi:hypothetical protein
MLEGQMKLHRLQSVFLMLGLCVAVHMSVAEAHHSFAQFDMSQHVTLKGTVRTWEWSNPHAWLWVYVSEVDGKPVTDKDGNPVIWGLETAAPGELTRSGITMKTFKPGDKITVEASPMKDGRNGGSMGKVTLDDGRVLGVGGAPAGVSSGGPPPGAPK